MSTFEEAVAAAQSAIIEDSCDTADRMPSQESWSQAGDDAKLAIRAALPVILAPLRELAGSWAEEGSDHRLTAITVDSEVISSYHRRIADSVMARADALADALDAIESEAKR